MKTLTVSQACKYCNVSQDTIMGWIRAGEISTETIGGHRRIRLDQLDQLLQSKNMQPDKSWMAPEKKILIVDDDKIVVETIVQALEEDEHGYDVLSAADGFEAQLQIKQFNPDLLILDIMMPDINGYEVCKKIKSDPETKDIKIIVLSAYLDDESYKRMQEHGADACFSKPLPLPELREQIARLIYE
jgi:excisionase family DNA binding protein